MSQPDIRVTPPIDTDELGTTLGFLDYHRGTLLTKVAGLDAAQLASAPTVSEMTLGGMLKHLAYVEDHWFSTVLAGHEPVEPWASVEWEADNDWEWHSAADDSPEQLRAQWDASVARSRAELAHVLDTATGDPLAVGSKRMGRAGRPISLRWILVHMIEEYCRHNGHADLLREAIDGTTGD